MLFRVKLIITCVLVVVIACSCSKKEQYDNKIFVKLHKNAKAPKTAVKYKPVSGIAAQPTTNFMVKKYIFAKDPFISFFQKISKQQNTYGVGYTLSLFNIDELKLVGVALGVKKPMALIKDPSGRGHSVRIGSKIGDSGEVVSIESDKIIINENKKIIILSLVNS